MKHVRDTNIFVKKCQNHGFVDVAELNMFNSGLSVTSLLLNNYIIYFILIFKIN